MSKVGVKLAVLGMAVAGVARISTAAQILEFKPVPVSSNVPEVIWTGVNLDEGPGSIGNGDGGLPLGQQTAGGLRVEVPFLINGIAGSQQNLVTGTTTFFDATLILSGLPATAGAVPVGTSLLQPIGFGEYLFTATDGTPLLFGQIGDALLTGETGSNAGNTLSGTVTYLGGAVHAAMIAAGYIPAGSMAVSLTADSPFAVGPNQAIAPFGADASGTFDAPIPEPATFGLLSLAALGLVARRTRQA